jgi:hypothetical protein
MFLLYHFHFNFYIRNCFLSFQIPQTDYLQFKVPCANQFGVFEEPGNVKSVDQISVVSS